MKIAITGHKRGLGQAIYNHFLSKNHEMIGFSRRQGIDIVKDFDRVCEVASECDLFFNNAHDGNVQAKYIQALAGKVKIITSGSMGADAPALSPYCFEKKQVEMTHMSLRKLAQTPMLLLKMGYLENYVDRNPIPYQQVLNAIDFWLDNPRVDLIQFPNK